MIHELKIWPAQFLAVRSGRKRHEWRRADRAFSIGDKLRLREWDPDAADYTGRSIEAVVTFTTEAPQFGVPEGYVVMSIETLGPWETCAALRTRIQQAHHIDFSDAYFCDLLCRCNPPGITIHRTRNGRRIDMVRASPEFVSWVVARVNRMRRKKS